MPKFPLAKRKNPILDRSMSVIPLSRSRDFGPCTPTMARPELTSVTYAFAPLASMCCWIQGSVFRRNMEDVMTRRCSSPKRITMTSSFTSPSSVHITEYRDCPSRSFSALFTMRYWTSGRASLPFTSSRPIRETSIMPTFSRTHSASSSTFE